MLERAARPRRAPGGRAVRPGPPGGAAADRRRRPAARRPPAGGDRARSRPPLTGRHSEVADLLRPDRPAAAGDPARDRHRSGRGARRRSPRRPPPVASSSPTRSPSTTSSASPPPRPVARHGSPGSRRPRPGHRGWPGPRARLAAPTGRAVPRGSGSATELTAVSSAGWTERPGRPPGPPRRRRAGHPDVDATTAALQGAPRAAGAGETVLLASALDEGDLLGRPRRACPPCSPGRPVAALESARIDGLYLHRWRPRRRRASPSSPPTASTSPTRSSRSPWPATSSGGPWSGLPVVTKGGLVGDDETAVACLAFLEQAAQARRRHVSPPHPNPLTRSTAKPFEPRREHVPVDRPVLALTIGDPVGIGPEITARTLAEYAGTPATTASLSVTRWPYACGGRHRPRRRGPRGHRLATPAAGEGVIDVLDTGVLGDRELPLGRGRRARRAGPRSPRSRSRPGPRWTAPSTAS